MQSVFVVQPRLFIFQLLEPSWFELVDALKTVRELVFGEYLTGFFQCLS